MNPLFQYLMNLSYPEQIFKLDMACFQNLPFSFYWKDAKGKYLGSNSFLASDAGFTESFELLGLTDFDLPWLKEAPFIKNNDNKVMTKDKAISFVEKVRNHTGSMGRYASLKTPLRGNPKKIIGIIGLSFLLEKDEPEMALFSELSQQQAKCLYYLVQGMTIKQIAKTLGLSPKTVEHYLDAVKIKLNCRSRSALVAKAINLGILYK